MIVPLISAGQPVHIPEWLNIEWWKNEGHHGQKLSFQWDKSKTPEAGSATLMQQVVSPITIQQLVKYGNNVPIGGEHAWPPVFLAYY